MGSDNSKEKFSKNKKLSLKHSLTTRLVIIKVPVNDNIWEKQYSIEAALEQVANDFKSANGMDIIQKNHFIEWRYKDQIIEMDKRKIKSFLPDENMVNIPPIVLEQEIKLMEGEEINLNICRIVGKPFYNPFEIYTFEPSRNLIKFKKYSQNLIVEKELDKFSIESAYCNGNNNLFLSGGVNAYTQEGLDLFWDIDLGTDDLSSPINMVPKKNHSMMYDDKKVYIVGGEDEKTLFYDTETKSMNKLSNLNIKRFEPSLIRSDNYLFCFDTSSRKSNTKFSIERINLTNAAQSKWEIIYPELSPKIGDKVYNQKFFGIIEDYKRNIIFLGGIHDNNENKTGEENNPIMNMKYNVNKNTIDNSDIPFQEISFGEKTFLPMDYKNYFILPNFPRRMPNVVYFGKEKNFFKISSYKSNPRIQKKKDEHNTRLFSSKIKASLFGLNFDMPGLHKEIDLNMNNNIELPTQHNNMNNNQENDNFKNDIVKGNEDTNDNNNINTGININTNSNFRRTKTFVFKEPEVKITTNPVENVDLNPKDININVNSGVNNENIDINERDNNNDVEINLKKFKIEKDINVNPIINTNLDSGNINAKMDSGNINAKIDTGNINAKIDTNINKDINANTKAEINTKINTNIEPEVNKKININETDSKTLKIKSSRPKAEIYIGGENFSIFHNSVHDPSSYIKKPRARPISLPKKISSKIIKQQSKRIDRNIYEINNY